jgi:predicted O-methyltransferase YrrM
VFDPRMDLGTVTSQVRQVRWMTPEQGAVVYDHIRTTKPTHALELGTAHGASAAYIAAALEENGTGHLTTVDRSDTDFVPGDLLASLGLGRWVTLVARDDSSYDWFLKEQIESRSDAAGNCEPLYDFCYLDGAHDWTIDGLAVFLVEKLLKPGGWLLLDDLEWSYAASPSGANPPFPISSEERQQPHMRAVYDLLVRQHPNFTQFRVQDGNWGWAQKVPGAPRRYEVTSSRTLAGLAMRGAWRLARTAAGTAARIRRR